MGSSLILHSQYWFSVLTGLSSCEPVSNPDQVRGRLSLENALMPVSAKEIPQHFVDGFGKFDLGKMAGTVEDLQSAVR